MLLIFTALVGLATYRYNLRLALTAVETDAATDIRHNLVRWQRGVDYLLGIGDLQQVRELFAAHGADAYIIRAFALDDSAHVIASLRHTDIGLYVGDVMTARGPESFAQLTEPINRVRRTLIPDISLTTDRLALRAVFPIRLSGEQIFAPRARVGVIYALYDLTGRKVQARRGVERQVIVFVAVLVALALAMWLMFHFLIARRAERLVAATKELAAGGDDVRSGVRGKDEIGDIGLAFDAMASEISQGRRLLADSEQRYRQLFNSGEDLILVAQRPSHVPAFKLVEANDTACRYLGYSREELLMLSPYDIVATEDHLRIPGLNKPPRLGDKFLYEVTLVGKDGKRIPVEATARVFNLQQRPTMLTIARDITGRRLAEQRLRESQDRFSKAFNASPDMITIVRMKDEHMVDVNETAVETVGYSREELLGRPIGDLGLGINQDTRDRIRHIVETDGRIFNYEINFLTKTGEKRTALFSGELIEISNDVCLLAVAKDITDRKHMEEQLFEEKERAQVTLYSIGDAVVTTDGNGLVEYLNPVAEQLTGWSVAEAKAAPLERIFALITEDTRVPVESPVQRCLKAGRPVMLRDHLILLGRNGREVAVEDSASPIRDRAGRVLGVVMVFRDVSAARIVTYQLSWQATHDALTGLVNRREFERRVSHAVETATNESVRHALLYLDLDQFKIVNDTCGHVAGDELLRQVSNLIQRRMREGDTLGRLGGDEFGVLLEHCSIDDAQRIAENLRRSIGDFRFVWRTHTFRIGASIGLVGITTDSGPLSTLMSAADIAMYAAKEQGRDRIHLYRASDAALARRTGEMRWVARITSALEENRFRLVRQAIRPVMHPNAAGQYEVLVRMIDETGKVVLPNAFMPAASRYGIMPAIDRWVVRNLFAHHAQWTDAHALYTVNLSAASLSEETFLGFVRDQFSVSHAPPERVCFEINETEAMANVPKTAEYMTDLKGLGCRFSLDDFGSGVSSFAYLRNLPVDYLKIDGSFIRGMADNPVDWAMVESINRVGHVLGIQTVAEFVENDRTLQGLRDLGVDYAQGYAIETPNEFL